MDKTQLYNIAKLYYLDNLGQQEIAKKTGISRPQISRMLKEARETGIVNITINKPFVVEDSYLSERLKELLGIQHVKIVSSSSLKVGDFENRMEHLTDYAAEYLSELIPSYSKVGIGWGSTVYRSLVKMPFGERKSPLCFLPLVGSVGISEPAYQTNSMVDRIAEKFKAETRFLNAPAFVPDEEVYQHLLKSIRGGAPNFWSGLNLAIFSIGVGVEDAPPTMVDSLRNANLLDTIQSHGAVGDLLGSYFDQNGEFCILENYPLIAIPFELFRQIPNRVCIAIGENKIKALIAGGRMNAFTELVTDNFTAVNLIQSAGIHIDTNGG